MTTFIVCLICLVLGYFVYGRFVEHIMQPDAQKQAPCYAMQDGVDFTPMPTWKVYLIQFLNIAGTGPIFGTIQGILFGPAAYFWIVLGCIFGGATHDYMAGMISMKRNGASLPEIIGDELGGVARQTQRVLALALMIFVVAVFVTSPAGLLNGMTGNVAGLDGYTFWVVVVFAYYIIAALVPIGKIIGNIYPIFGVVLLVMAVCMFVGIFTQEGGLPEITEAFQNHHPLKDSLPVFPGICITIACGAVSGFHATQSPMMARCMKNEKLGRKVFYGAMITEGIIALIWAAAAIKFADSLSVDGSTPYEKLYNLGTENGTKPMNPALIVNTICNSWLGSAGAILAILGVICAPITTGDTAFRCARLILADMFKIKQNKVLKRVLVCIPIFLVSLYLILNFKQFATLWAYFSWFNQTFAIFTFFAIAVYLAKLKKPYIVTLIPGMFMMCVCVSFLCVDKSSFGLSAMTSYLIGGGFALASAVWFFVWKARCAGKSGLINKE